MTLQRESFGDFSLLRRPGRGDAPISVHFAHATGLNANTYRHLFQMFDPAIDLYAMDARGHGLSKARAVPRELRSWRPFERDLESLIATLPSPVILAGHSFGGTISIAVAARRPDLVAGLVLFDPVLTPTRIGRWAPLARALGLTSRIPIARGAARRRPAFPSAEAAIDHFAEKSVFKTWPRPFIEDYVEGGTEPSQDGVRLTCTPAWESRTFAKATTRPFVDVQRLRCPTTLIARVQAGPPLTAESYDAFARFRPDARLVRLESVTHFMTMERPDLVRDEIHRMAGIVRSELR